MLDHNRMETAACAVSLSNFGRLQYPLGLRVHLRREQELTIDVHKCNIIKVCKVIFKLQVYGGKILLVCSLSFRDKIEGQ